MAAALIVDILRSCAIHGKKVPEAFRGRIRELMQKVAERSSVGEEPMLLKPSKTSRRFGEFALAQYEYGNVEDRKEIGFTDKLRSWAELAKVLQSPGETKALVVQTAFNQVTERILQAARQAPKAGSANEDERKQYDQALIDSMQGAIGTKIFAALDAQKKRDLEGRFRQAIGQITKRGVVKTDASWMATEAFKQTKSGHAPKSKL